MKLCSNSCRNTYEAIDGAAASRCDKMNAWAVQTEKLVILRRKGSRSEYVHCASFLGAKPLLTVVWVMYA